MWQIIFIISSILLVIYVCKWIFRLAWNICKSIYHLFKKSKKEIPQETKVEEKEYIIPSLKNYTPPPPLTEEERKAIIEKEKKEREDQEAREIRRKILERERKKQKEKEIYNQLLDEGLIYADEANKRPPIPRDIVDAVWRRDKGQCVYCGSKENLQLDHIIPFSKGGATTFENLQLLCQKCNLKKSNHIG